MHSNNISVLRDEITLNNLKRDKLYFMSRSTGEEHCKRYEQSKSAPLHRGIHTGKRGAVRTFWNVRRRSSAKGAVNNVL